MKNFKIFLWIFVIFLIQTVLLGHLHLFGAAPSIVLAYVVCVTIMENEFRTFAAVSIICAAVMGALCGRDFIITTLFYVYSSLIIFALRKKPLYLSNAVKAAVWTAAASAVLELLYLLPGGSTLGLHYILHSVVPTVVFNTVLVLVLYPILKKTMYKEEKTKLLIA